MFHPPDSARLFVCDTELYLEQNDIGLITVAICGGYMSKYPGGRLNKKDGLTRYGDSHVKDKTS